MLKLVTAPANTAASLDEVKDYCQVARTDTTFDDFLNERIAEATDLLEPYLGRALITRKYESYSDGWVLNNEGILEIPMPPTQSDEFVIQYYDSNDALQTWSTDDYELDTISEPARVRPKSGKSWPSVSSRFNSVKITLKAGFGDDSEDVPGSIRTAICVMVANRFAVREDYVLGVTVMSIPADKTAYANVLNYKMKLLA